ncbi:hypothetical protein BO78DRAFT_420463 [Aspergillus sclerotiicarbonarius CBS 121057]|uniref:Uncharacterized protein n=1 Tax=Aspergillus sclerotiicarbonarius (strain CBS 121057 / IBT 28362) TaxID=1448318 RepID=A0A319FDJ9_ASPSB|nr:hypothetical protein BO78DRAFT_420463 [Aspergillus sclerotiicarbonarius CBS 121057]
MVHSVNEDDNDDDDDDDDNPAPTDSIPLHMCIPSKLGPFSAPRFNYGVRPDALAYLHTFQGRKYSGLHMGYTYSVLSLPTKAHPHLQSATQHSRRPQFRST